MLSFYGVPAVLEEVEPCPVSCASTGAVSQGTTGDGWNYPHPPGAEEFAEGGE